MNRRDFLKGLLATVATGALIKGGIVQPEQVIAEPKRRVFDMAQNTWRWESYTWRGEGYTGSLLDLSGNSNHLIGGNYWSFYAKFDPPLEFDGMGYLEIGGYRCRCVLSDTLRPTQFWLLTNDGVYVCPDLSVAKPEWRFVRTITPKRAFL